MVDIFHVFQDALGLDLLTVLENAFGGNDLMRQNSDAVLLDKIERKICDALCSDDYTSSLLARVHPGDSLFSEVGPVARDVDKIFRKECVELIFEFFTAYRFRQISVEVLSRVERSVLCICVCREDDDACISASAACLFLDLPAAFDTVHLGHEVIHEDDVIFDIECLLECIGAA